jgi:hypothetical protein
MARDGIMGDVLCLFISLFSLNHDLNNWQRGVAKLLSAALS